ncbi:MAG: ATP-binding protein [Pseudomonadota bacterium]
MEHTPDFPRAPSNIEETGLPFVFLVELVAKVLLMRGQLRLPELASHLKLSISVLDPLIAFMRAEKLCDTNRRGSSGTDADLSYSLTDLGRQRASLFMHRNAYAGAAPVTLAAYCAQVRLQSVTRLRTTQRSIGRVLNAMVIDAAVLEQLGAAMNSGRAIFVYGPPGSGKTFLAERLHALLHGNILVPHAIMVDGEVLPFYDAMVHRRVIDADRSVLPDGRWLRIERATVLTGGELTLDMLDLQFDPGSRLYHTPTHLKANNGIFIIDDLGRQRCSAVELLNRWIVPMDRREDYLTLHTGYKFSVPFDMTIVFSSNFAPDQLADGAFLRRLAYKIHVGALSTAQYESVFKAMCVEYGIAFCANAFAYLLREHHEKEGRALLACYPRDILGQVRDLARYEEREPRLSEPILSWAWNNYFTAATAAPLASTVFYERRNRTANQEKS